ncbi:MAG: hypothetical protein Q6373_009385 [Candidatus Sigynarchaeota archaeon]
MAFLPSSGIGERVVGGSGCNVVHRTRDYRVPFNSLGRAGAREALDAGTFGAAFPPAMP